MLYPFPKLLDYGKLMRIKGIQQFDTNYAIALDPKPSVIRHHKVWEQIGILKESNGGKMPRILRRSDLIDVPSGRYAGLWRIVSVKDAKAGFFLDMVRPYATKAENKTDFAVINCRLNTLIQDGIKILKPKYTGISQCRTMSSTSPKQEA